MTAIANSGNLYQLSVLDKITDSEGNVLEKNEPKLTNKIELKQSTWDMVHTGMYKVCDRIFLPFANGRTESDSGR